MHENPVFQHKPDLSRRGERGSFKTPNESDQIFGFKGSPSARALP